MNYPFPPASIALSHSRWGILISLLLAAFTLHAAAAQRESRPPNIIFILADDLGYGDLSCYGQEHFTTPHIDQLAQEGMRFTQHYSGSTVCAPSRSVLLTGLHTGHTPIRGNKEIQPEGQHPLPAHTDTFARRLQTAGYTTGVFGKWGLGYPSSEGEPLSQGFDRFYGYNCQRLGHHYYPSHLWDDDQTVELTGNAAGGSEQYAPHLIHDQTLAFIEENQDQPFFCFVASIIPHAEMVAPEELMRKHRGRYGPETPFVGTDDGPKFRLGPYQSQATPKAAFAAMVELLDQQVGEIVAKLDDLGIRENTLIIFTSDNGPAQEGGADPHYFNSNGGLRGIKRDLYEGGIRVPLIANWPGRIVADSKSCHISAFWDFYPTFLDLARLPHPTKGDGISIAPTLLASGIQEQHEYLYWEFHEGGGRVAVRQGYWKAVRYNVLKDPDGPLQRFDLSKDPSEQRNIAEQHPEITAQLDELLRDARTPSPVFTFGQSGYLQSK
ncbi:MAG: arylsulfatase [Synoicihabitans sp.]